MFWFLALLVCGVSCVAPGVLFFNKGDGVARLDRSTARSIKAAGGGGLSLGGVVDGRVFLYNKKSLFVYCNSGGLSRLCNDGVDSVVCSRLGAYVDNGCGVVVHRDGESTYCCSESGGGTLASDGCNVVLWSDATLSLVSVTGGWSWNFYRNGDGVVDVVRQPKLRFCRGAVLVSWPDLTVCVGRGRELWRCCGRCLGSCGNYAIICDKRGILCIDRVTGKGRVLVEPSRLRGLKDVCVIGDRLCLMSSGGVVTVALPALIKHKRMTLKRYAGSTKVLGDCVAVGSNVLCGVGGVVKLVPSKSILHTL